MKGDVGCMMMMCFWMERRETEEKLMIPLVLSSRFVLYNISDVDFNTN
jgi:hypothetical protein